MKIFIGSSRESLDLVRQIEVWLEPHGHETLPWDTPGLFPPGEQTLYTLVSISRRVDAAIFLFSEDDRVWYREDSVPQPRDNVLIEYGLFIGTLGPKKAIICTDGTPKVAVDLRGLTHVDVTESKRRAGRYNLQLWSKALTPGSDDPELARLRVRVTEVERGNETLSNQVKFLEGSVSDLKILLTRNEKVDFAHYDLKSDGHWKLLFDFDYFEAATQGLARLVYKPMDLRKLLVDAGAEPVANRIAWHQPDRDNIINENPQMRGWFAKKILRVFRDHGEKNQFLEFLDVAPKPVRNVFDDCAKAALGRRKNQLNQSALSE